MRSALAKALDVKPSEAKALLLAFAYFFFLLATYYVLRPVRDEMGVRSGVRSLPSLFTATFVVTLILAPVYAALVARLKRRMFVPLVYGFLLSNLVAFWGLLTAGVAVAALQMVFFVWLTVFAVFGVSVFWSFMADIFSGEQAKRLYPTIAAGGALGGFAGSATVTGLATAIGPANLLLVAAGLLALTIVFAASIEGEAVDQAPEGGGASGKAVGGGWLSGLAVIFRSPYLAGILCWVFLLSLANSLAYGSQNAILGASGLDSGERTRIFGAIDLSANILIPAIQFTIARWSLRRLGVGITLGAVAAVFLVGLAGLAAAPTLAVLVAFQIAQRTGQFALSNPARESLWSVVAREDKYKAKNVIDNAGFRGADVITIALFASLFEGLGLGVPIIAMIGVPVMALWFILSLVLGRARERRAGLSNPGVS